MLLKNIPTCFVPTIVVTMMTSCLQVYNIMKGLRIIIVITMILY